MTRQLLVKSFNPALYFNSTSTFINCGTSATLRVETGTNWSLEVWIKPDGVPPLSGNRYAILGFYTPGWVMDIVNDSGVYGYRFYTGAAGYNYVSSISQNWTHFVVTYDNGTFKTFINGVLKKTWTGVTLVTSTNPLIIGKRTDGMYFKGLIGETRMYRRTLSELEVEKHYNGLYVNETGLAGYWKINEGGGSTIFDSSGNNNTGTITADQWIEKGGTINLATRQTGTRTQNTIQRMQISDFGSCGLFNGTDDYVDCGAGSSLNITDKITIAAWIYPVSDLGGMYIVAKNSTGAADHQYAIFREQSNDNLNGWINGAARGNSAINSILINRWYHIAMVYNRTDVRYYVNGALSGTPYAYTAAITGTAFNLNIGRRQPSTIYWKGRLDNVLIFARDLSAQEISNLYLTGQFNRNELRGEWKFNEGSGSAVADSSNNGNNGTWNGTGGYWSTNSPMKSRLIA